MKLKVFCSQLLYCIAGYLCSLSVCTSLHLKGEWKTDQFFKFLAKFGFQKTNLKDQMSTQGYIYGNITADVPYNQSSTAYTLVVVDREYFLHFYGNRTLPSKDLSCSKMFKLISRIAFDSKCNVNGLEDFLRKIPCPQGGICTDEDTPERMIRGSQFSYAIHEINQPRFYYVSLVACHLSSIDCEYHPSPSPHTINYDLWLVNGHPDTWHMNPLEHQFSFHLIDTFELHLFSWLMYLVLVIIEVVIMRRSSLSHPLIYLYLSCLVLELLASSLHVLHCVKYTQDGVGFPLTSTSSSLISNILAQGLFVLLLLLLAQGWNKMSHGLSHRILILGAWLLYVALSVLLFIWNQTEVSVISDVDYYQTWPGYLILSARLILMLLFLAQLRRTFKLESNRHRLDFYIHFGSGFLVWFVYLPILALVAAHVSALWRTKLILGVCSCVNILYYMILMNLLWPSRSNRYIYIREESEEDELEEYERERIRAEEL